MRKYLILVLGFTLLGCHRDESPPPRPADARAEATPLDADSRAILDAALKDVLTNPDLEDARTFYGEKNARLVAYYANYFPKGYAPSVPGFQFVRYAGDREVPPMPPGCSSSIFDGFEANQPDCRPMIRRTARITKIGTGLN